MAESYYKNANGYKNSCQKYRIINGIKYQQWTFNKSDFDKEKAIAKEMGLKIRIINGELYREVITR